MATSSKPTAVHFALVFFVMTTLILALVSYLTGKEFADKSAEVQRQSEELNRLQTSVSNSLDEINTLKELLGYQFEEVGSPQETENTVYGAAVQDLVNLGREQVQPSPQQPTVAATLQSLRSALNASQNQVSTQQSGLQDTESRLEQELTSYRNRVQELQTSQEESETQLQRLVTERDELLGEKDREIAKWRQDYRNELVEKQTLLDELERVRNEKNSVIADLENVVDHLRDQLNELENLSFDRPDGKIVRVDNTTRTVWIDLGTADNLQKQVSFSVYTKAHHGVARGREDIKAKIEVTRIRGPKLAEARIIDEDLRRPIQEGDPIHTPLWSRGMSPYYSFVGVLDMNGDGKSDRELLHSVLQNAGAKIEVEVNDKGERIPEDGALSVRTKFLVIGEIEDPTEYPGYDDKQQEIQKVMEERSKLMSEARRQGIRVVNFPDFLSYIGFIPQQRLYVAGEDRKFTLKAGARSASTDDVMGTSRLSTGQVSEIFKRDGSRRQKESEGTTSGMYRN